MKITRLFSISFIIVICLASLSFAAYTQAEIDKVKGLIGTQGQNNSSYSNPQENINLSAGRPLMELSSIEKSFGLNQFGYDIFASSRTLLSDAPVGGDYMLGPGDAFSITLWGITEGVIEAVVDQEGNITLPKVGVVNVAGVRYGELEEVIKQRLSSYYEKVNVSVSVKRLRNITIYLVGEINAPGSYSISSLTTTFNALFLGGGPKKSGSLRNIKLIRYGKTVAIIDLYKFLLSGDKTQDIPLRDGDTIFIPLLSDVVVVKGDVRRPAIYEIKGATDLGSAIDTAGGFIPTANLSRVQLERVDNYKRKILIDKKLSLSESKHFGIPLKNMDIVTIGAIYAVVTNFVNLEGAVKYPGQYEFKEGMRLKDIILKPSLLLGSPQLTQGEVIRVDKNTLEVKIMPFSLEKLFSQDQSQNFVLKEEDRIVVVEKNTEIPKITLNGEVVLPGDYYVVPGETLSSVLARAQGFTSDAYLYGAVFTRVSAKERQSKASKRFFEEFNLLLLREEKSAAASSLSDENLSATKEQLQRGKEISNQILQKEFDGRVIIKLTQLDNFKNSTDDIAIEDGDTLFVPKMPETISIVGSTYGEGNVVYVDKAKVSDYVKKMGGFTKYADRDNLQVLKADGSIMGRSQDASLMSKTLMPGDVIFVPEKIKEENFLLSFKEFTNWIYQVAVTSAVLVTIFK
ncbi:hypothetical protein A3J90_06550 [candidate division WOR-1 bacterium RIFOXYC2_FULL_37_10]|uniref:Soluble ligand binding domain-containing protein n=1 Tax=candidate division WOR-1 bacterium RIFOXYB2_FULL_37_13 TaxID=1802579 RepID=A0A1F4SQ56_UNCSA|nr:MAG: hypothetical protein A2310_07405 [candidate division WOR-1 bacterium RIFOXYB2_FULL_37_13]OGC33362.1 MAG: hypothetical protein A3J90_06550 [candidate division WOR-1 bacterium RIFOXYC2_FULL_37_10]